MSAKKKAPRKSRKRAVTIPELEEGGLGKRIHDQREEMFGAMAIVAVARDAVPFDDNCDLHRALDDAYKWFYRIAGDLCEIAGNVGAYPGQGGAK